jgi:archaellum component FlaF (FlaF/FlaG flagellin family)
MKNQNVKAAIILSVATIVSSAIVYLALVHVGDRIGKAGQDIGLSIANKSSLRVDVVSTE